ncbi:hypothetical protein PBI_DEWDROP_64 [Microbacterium phage Dewdrop]|nr:hypothetical protein PBI_LEAF_64 [Microbacterium phage Leaf]QGZ17433.1 hypothetical protein PBI_DEWDROP_64 [Microbacterium phage Dewdrop]
MPINDALLNAGATAMGTAAAYASIHTAQPNAAGNNESTAARQLIDWSTASAGDLALDAPLAFTGGAAGGPATHLGLWSAPTAGTFYGYFPLTGDQAFNAAGEFTVTALALTGSATGA